MNDYAELRGLAPHIISKDGSIMPFEDQVESFAFGELPSGDMLVVAGDAAEAGIPEAGNLPILMKQKVVRKVQADHSISLGELKKVPDWLRNHPLALESITETNALVVIADALDVHRNHIIVALHLEKDHRQAIVNEIASIYGKRDLEYLIENTDALGKAVFLNERTGDWIRRTGLPLPERIANRLHNDYTSPSGHPQQTEAMASLLRGNDYYDPITGTYLDSRLNDTEPELIAYKVSPAEFMGAVDKLRALEADYRDGAIAPYQIAAQEAESEDRQERLDMKRDEARIEQFAAAITAGGWIAVGADIDSFIDQIREAHPAPTPIPIRPARTPAARRDIDLDLKSAARSAEAQLDMHQALGRHPRRP